MYIYIASPYTKGDPAVNVRVSLWAAERVISKGHTPFTPLLCHLWHLVEPKPYEYWVKLNLAWVARCDAMLRLPGESVGADLEVAKAKELNLPIYYGLENLP